jgi:hypothetical protein
MNIYRERYWSGSPSTTVNVLNRPFYSIDTKHRDAIVKALADAGITVEERKDLEFW